MKRLQKKYFAFYYHTNSLSRLAWNILLIAIWTVAAINSILDRSPLGVLWMTGVVCVWLIGSRYNRTWIANKKVWEEKFKRYAIRYRATGLICDSGLSKSEAEIMVNQYECFDMRRNVYEAGIYEIVEQSK